MTKSLRRANAMAALLALLLVSGAAAAPASRNTGVDRETGRVTDLLSAYGRVDLDAYDAVRRVRAGEPLHIATPTLAFDVRLVENDIRSSDCVVQVTHAGGVVERLDPGPVTTYRGTVDGMPDAEARFTIDEDGVALRVRYASIDKTPPRDLTWLERLLIVGRRPAEIAAIPAETRLT